MTDPLTPEWYAELVTGTRYEVRFINRDNHDETFHTYANEGEARRERDRMEKRLPCFEWYVKPTEEILL